MLNCFQLIGNLASIFPMRRRTILFSVLAICVSAYLGAERGSYRANYFWARTSVERKEKMDAQSEKQRTIEALDLRKAILKGVDQASKDRWDKYDKCLKLGGAKTGRTGTSELGLSQAIPSWMQYCLTGTISMPNNIDRSTQETQ